MKMKIFVGIVAISILAYIAAMPYITIYQMGKAFRDRDGEALSEHIDFPPFRQSLKNYIDAARDKDMAKQAKEGDRFGALAIAVASVVAKRAIDIYVTPAGITELMKEEEISADKIMDQAFMEIVNDLDLEDLPPLPPSLFPQPNSPVVNSAGSPFPLLLEEMPSLPPSLQMQPADDPDDSAQSESSPNLSMSYESFDKFLIVMGNSDSGVGKITLRRSGINWKLTEIVLPVDKLW